MFTYNASSADLGGVFLTNDFLFYDDAVLSVTNYRGPRVDVRYALHTTLYATGEKVVGSYLMT